MEVQLDTMDAGVAARQRQPSVVDVSEQDLAATHAMLLAKLDEIKRDTRPLASKHAVNFYINVEKKEGSQQVKVTCAACGKSITSTGSSRLVDHIAKTCPLMPKEVVKAFMQLKKESTNKACGKRAAEVLAMEESEIFAKRYDAEQASLKQTGIKSSMGGPAAAWADKCIAEFFYANAIPFGAASSEAGSLYRRMFEAVKHAPAGYKPPNYKKLAGDLLDKTYEDLWKSIKLRDPTGSIAFKFGSAYVTDGWASCDNLSLINSAFITNNDGGIYWRSVDTSGSVKCAEYTAMLMILDIYDYGPTKVVLIITDTCAVMQRAWEIVMAEFPWISVLPCQPHVISLLLKDIGKTPEVVRLVQEESIVTQWFSNHHFPLSKLRELTLRILKKPLELVKAATTRFGTHTLVGERLIALMPALQVRLRRRPLEMPPACSWVSG